MTEPWWGPVINYAILIGTIGIVLVTLLRNILPKFVKAPIALCCFVTLLVALPALFFVDNRSIALFRQQEATDAVLITLFGGILTFFAFRARQSRTGQPISTWRRVGGILVGLMIFAWGLIQGDRTVKDLTLPNEHVQGTIAAVHHSHDRRGHAEAGQVEIGSAWYNVTTDIEPFLVIGTDVDAEAGAGSRFILVLTKPVPVANTSDVFSHGN